MKTKQNEKIKISKYSEGEDVSGGDGLKYEIGPVGWVRFGRRADGCCWGFQSLQLLPVDGWCGFIDVSRVVASSCTSCALLVGCLSGSRRTAEAR